MADYSEFRCPWIIKEDLWQKVDTFSNQYWPEESIPVDMELIVEDRLELFIEPVHSLVDGYDVDAWLRVDLSGIVVDYDRYMEKRFQNRLRFSLAHEIGHFILHREILEELPFNKPEEWKKFILAMPDQEYRSFEWQANEFAGRLLVPRSSLADQIAKTKDTIKENKLVEFLKNDPDAVLESISPLICKPFGVSERVVAIRAKRESLWPPEL